MWQRGRFAGVVVAGDRQHAAMAAGAKGIGMLEHVHAAVYARSLAVPHAEDPVVTSFGEEGGLLTAPDRGGGKLLVDARLKVDVVTLEKGLRLPHGLIDSPKRTASISGDESCRVEPSSGIPLVLQHWQSYQRFNASHIGPGLV